MASFSVFSYIFTENYVNNKLNSFFVFIIWSHKNTLMDFNQSGLIEQAVKLWAHKHPLIPAFLAYCLHFVVIVHHHSNTSCYWSKGEQSWKAQGYEVHSESEIQPLKNLKNWQKKWSFSHKLDFIVWT